MIEPTLEEYQAALKVVSDYSGDRDPDLDLPRETMQRGIIKALRWILRCGEGESVLYRAVTVIRRHDDMARQLGNNFH